MKTNSMKSLAIAVVAGSLLATVSTFALSQTEIQTISQTLSAAKVVEVPSKAAKMVAGAAKESKIEVATAVVTSSIKAHPSTVGSVIVSVLRVAPEATESVVTAALEAAPQSALTIIAAAAEGAPAQSDKAIAIASAKMPTRAAAFEREAAVIKGRRAVENAAAITGGTVTQQPRQGSAPTEVYAQAGGASNRP